MILEDVLVYLDVVGGPAAQAYYLPAGHPLPRVGESLAIGWSLPIGYEVIAVRHEWSVKDLGGIRPRVVITCKTVVPQPVPDRDHPTPKD